MDTLDKQIKDHLERKKTERDHVAEKEGLDRDNPPPEWVVRAKDMFPKPEAVQCPYCRKPITPFKKSLKTQNLVNYLWLALSALAFAGSFALRRYFFQCLALALFFGIKWAVDLKSTKTQILIYKALKDEEPGVRSRDLHNRSAHL